jgi:hypothetical protein
VSLSETKVIKPRGVQPRIPVAQSITASNIQHAYGFRESRYQQKRINTWERLKQQSLGDLGAKMVKKIKK